MRQSVVSLRTRRLLSHIIFTSVVLAQAVASQATRRLILEEGYRVDGRGVTDVRPIWARASCLPRVHGSALFTRGETQILAVATLGRFMHHVCITSELSCTATSLCNVCIGHKSTCRQIALLWKYRCNQNAVIGHDYIILIMRMF